MALEGRDIRYCTWVRQQHANAAGPADIHINLDHDDGVSEPASVDPCDMAALR